MSSNVTLYSCNWRYRFLPAQFLLLRNIFSIVGSEFDLRSLCLQSFTLRLVPGTVLLRRGLETCPCRDYGGNRDKGRSDVAAGSRRANLNHYLTARRFQNQYLLTSSATTSYCTKYYSHGTRVKITSIATLSTSKNIPKVVNKLNEFVRVERSSINQC